VVEAQDTAIAFAGKLGDGVLKAPMLPATRDDEDGAYDPKEDEMQEEPVRRVRQRADW
jgi:hypothetical protein